MILTVNFFRSLALGLILTLASPAVAPADPFQVNGKPVPEKVAVVNGVALDSKLLISEIKVFRLMNRQKNKELTEKEMDEFSHQALARLVDQELIFQEARKKNIAIKPELLDQRVEEVQKQFPSEQMLHTALDMQGLTLDLLKTKFEKQMAEEALIRHEVVPKVKVDDSEVEAFIRNIWTDLKLRNATRFTISSPPLCNRPHTARIFQILLYAKKRNVSITCSRRMRKKRSGAWIINCRMEPISRNWPGNILKMARAAPKEDFGER